MSLVITSATITAITTAQKRAGSGLALAAIFLFLLAGDAQARMRKRIESVEVDVVAAGVAFSKRLGRPIETPKRFIDVPEEPAFLAREEERLLALHGIGALIGHVERIGAQISIRALQ